MSLARAIGPIDALIVCRRVVNALMLYAKQKLMPEEFQVMKTHATVGAAMLKALPAYQDEALMKSVAGTMSVGMARAIRTGWQGIIFPLRHRWFPLRMLMMR